MKVKRVVLIDDSIVRGTTSRRIVKLLRDAGAREIHMRISAPPFLHPCYYGTDIDSEENLIACHHTTDGDREAHRSGFPGLSGGGKPGQADRQQKLLRCLFPGRLSDKDTGRPPEGPF